MMFFIRFAFAGFSCLLIAVSAVFSLARSAPYDGEVLCQVTSDQHALEPGWYFLSIPELKTLRMNAPQNATLDVGIISPGYRWRTDHMEAIQDGSGDVWLIRNASSFMNNLTNTSARVEWVSAWSPDSQQILVESYAVDGEISERSLSVFNIHTRQLSALVNLDGYLIESRWSPDGKWIAYGMSSGDVYLFNVKTGENRLLNISGRLQSWSPDSKTLLLSHYSDNGSELILLDITTDTIVIDIPINIAKLLKNDQVIFRDMATHRRVYLMNLKTQEFYVLNDEFQNFECSIITWDGFFQNYPWIY